MPGPRLPRWLGWVGVPLLALLVLALLFRWDWLIPIVESRASAQLGRPVHIQHLHVSPGRVTEVSADGVRVDNPEGFPAEPPFAQAERLTVRLDVMAFWRDRSIVIPRIEVEKPRLEVLADAQGRNNYTFPFASAPAEPAPAGQQPAPGPQIGDLVINDGRAHVALAGMRSDFNVTMNTRQEPGREAQIVAEARGTYAAQPITGRLVGGALLSLRDAERPWPVQMQLANGPTRVSLEGTLEDPLAFRGARLRLELSGPDMGLLLPLTGVPIPKTPPYRIAGRLDYAEGRVRFTDFEGRLGSSDLAGTITVSTAGERPDVTADLRSNRVDLADLGGFIGSEPGRVTTPGQTAQQRQQVARAEASPRLLPDTPINLPKFRAADVHLRYRAASIRGENVPFDNIAANLDLVDGAIRVHPVSFSVGQGAMTGTFSLEPGANDVFRTQGEVQLRRLDVGRLMRATGVFGGAGTISGTARIDTTGNSLGQMLGRGNGGLTMTMAGGDLSSLLLDLSGLRFGSAILSALGIPTRSRVECMVADFALQRGVLQTRTLLLETEDHRLTGRGSIDLGQERINYELRTDAKHFTVGSLPGPIELGGTFKDPSIMPGAEAAVRGGAAAGLGLLAAPLALLPTIQFGVGDDDDCARQLRRAQQPAGATGRTPARRGSRR
ncbi:AsmA family protein [Roseomonas sp. NAR14]|uniref:AsmA family protein n=1 Tax=Roseomonas acroporae TaxID=2937791 RepID=A0A9X1Y6F5_9PROT|nr:AsmA family protein [Roseomonas acroporae]MCK8783997.1 AsmA family protein [Roseomonas acroporae]